MAETDLTFLREFCRNDQAKMAQYIRMFLETLPETDRELEQAMNHKNLAAIRAAVHSLKPQVTFLGFNGLTTDIESIEVSIDLRSTFEEVAPLLAELKQKLERASGVLVESLLLLS
jgi:HPt (histidine-containing phosphotransfer) domain-containing protein